MWLNIVVIVTCCVANITLSLLIHVFICNIASVKRVVLILLMHYANISIIIIIIIISIPSVPTLAQLSHIVLLWQGPEQAELSVTVVSNGYNRKDSEVRTTNLTPGLKPTYLFFFLSLSLSNFYISLSLSLSLSVRVCCVFCGVGSNFLFPFFSFFLSFFSFSLFPLPRTFF